MSGGVPAGEGPKTLCLACCRTLKEHGAKRQCPETTYFIANRATPTPPIEGRDADVERVELIARIIDPAAFFGFDSLEAYCIRSGDTPEEAKATAEWAHAKEIEKARDKARAALQALGERG